MSVWPFVLAPLTEAERRDILAFLTWLSEGQRVVGVDIYPHPGAVRLSLSRGYADDGTTGLPIYRVTPKGMRLLAGL